MARLLRNFQWPSVAPLALWAIACFSPASAMDYDPFPVCTENSQVDSMVAWVYRDESMDPELAPYRGIAHLRFHAGTCFVSNVVQKPYYMDTLFTNSATLSADHRVQEVTWGTDGDFPAPHATTWYSAQGKEDSTLYYSPIHDILSDSITWNLTFQRIVRKPGYETHKTWVSRSGNPYFLVTTDSVVPSGGGVIVHTYGEEVNTITSCVRTTTSMTCTPRENGENMFELRKQTWYLGSGKADSLRTFDMEGNLLSVDHYFWSARSLGVVRRRAPTREARARSYLAGEKEFNVLGRRIKSLPGPARYPR